jgi:hypothetical protein
MAADDPRAIDVFELPDGRTMEIRPTRRGDADRLRRLYEELPPEDLRRRFFGAFMPHVEWCRNWASVGSRGGFGVVAVVYGASDHHEGGDRQDDDGGVVVAEAGYALRSDGDGDFAITVDRDWRTWLGSYLLDLVVRHAAHNGVENLHADVMLENTPMITLLRDRGPVAYGHDDGVVHLSIGTIGTTPTWPPNDERPRVLIEVAGGRWAGERAAERAGLMTAMCAGPAHRGRRACPVLDGGSCPLADAADVIVVLLDPDREETQRLVESHRRRSPGTPVLVRHVERADEDAPVVPGCLEIGAGTGLAVDQVLSLLGRPAGEGQEP